MNPLLLDFPDSFETERLTIRAPRVEDAAEVIAAVTESLTELRPWMPWAKDVPTLEGTQIRLRQAMANWIIRHDLPLHAYLKGTSTFVMGSGLHRMDWESGKFEIGYWVRTKYVGQGFVTEAVNGITAYAFREPARQSGGDSLRRGEHPQCGCGQTLRFPAGRHSASRCLGCRRPAAQHDDLFQVNAQRIQLLRRMSSD